MTEIMSKIFDDLYILEPVMSEQKLRFLMPDIWL